MGKTVRARAGAGAGQKCTGSTTLVLSENDSLITSAEIFVNWTLNVSWGM
jgi:hypothetical protein